MTQQTNNHSKRIKGLRAIMGSSTTFSFNNQGTIKRKENNEGSMNATWTKKKL